ncbi:hypothetical protein F2Q69_00008283 [Brassica cretica]|uniref:Uncharacterized protein n=1 Tax=Brassica cretica TaxID=69181 RepID=A0A8S9PG77_BRACR|nr:hypothetical protein F2Q69_00008283 [Brassica cretica]
MLALVYPPKNLVVYLSDDASSQLTFYALTEAAEFAKTWVPFCKEFDIEPRSSIINKMTKKIITISKDGPPPRWSISRLSSQQEQ